MMRLMIACLAGALLGAAMSGTPARAEPPQAVASAPSANQLVLTRRYIDLMMSDQFEDALRQMIADQLAVDPSVRALPEEDRRFIVELTAELTADMMPRMLDAMVPVYARSFTEPELEALIAFYDTDRGRAIIEKTTVAMPEATREAMTVMPAMLDKMGVRICQHYGCEPGDLEALQDAMRNGAGAVPRDK